MKKAIAVILTGSMIVSCLTGCGSGGTEESKYADSINVLIYPDYLSESVLESFTEQYGIEVNVTYCSGESDILTKIESGDDYDLIQPSQESTHALISGDYLQEIDKESMENYSNISEQYQEFLYPDDADYIVPYMSGSYMVMVDPETCPVDITCWDDLLDPALEGKIASVSPSRDIFSMILAAKGLDPNAKDEESIEEAYEWLNEYNENVKVYDDGAPRNSVENGECCVALTYASDVAIAMMENPDAGYYVPDMSDYWYCYATQVFAVPKASKKSTEAQMLMDWILDGENYAEILMEYPGVSINEAATEFLDETTREALSIFEIPEDKEDQTYEQYAIGEAQEIYDTYIAKILGN
ncbi:MAG: spermidine/putrescine ABC transporter substrate-binding protein [Clostridiaceae bacterium]|nr:spermidine/putrescine ABC transporter substrate-binding protein [Clostridiaceae bacterium]